MNYIQHKNVKHKSNYDLMCKFLIIGSSQVGKTNLLTRFTDNQYSESHISTIGVDFRFKEMKINGKQMKMQIWDTAGQERFRTLTQNYYKGAQGVLLVYAIDDQQSFTDVKQWIESLKQHGRPEIQIILVANKADLEESRIITQGQGMELAAELNIEYYETSAKTGQNVIEVFESLAKLVDNCHTQYMFSLTNTVDESRIKLDDQQKQKQQEKKHRECC